MNLFKQTIVLSLLMLGVAATGNTQNSKTKVEYTSADKLTIVGKAFDTPLPYHRVDTAVYSNLPNNVKLRFTRSAGIAISFKTNSTSIHAKWTTDSRTSSVGLTPIAYRGLDLYIKKDGKWQFAGVGKPKNGSQDSEDVLVQNLEAGEHECLLYLPIYSETQALSIGVEPGATLVPGDYPFHKKVLVYGSSIVQGAGASRPGMAYAARLARATGFDFINLGTAGIAQMQPEVVNMIEDIKADVYLLDCIPNSSAKMINQRAGKLIKQIRKKNPKAPIIMMETVIRESSYFDQKLGEKVKSQNEAIKAVVDNLQAKGMKNLHYISAENLLGDDHEGTVDGTHPNDIGFSRMISVIQPKIQELLK